MESANKMIVLNLISENKDILFGKFDTNLTVDMKIEKWKQITEQLQEMDVFHKDWKYLRDITWQNWRRRAIEKQSNRQKGKKGTLNATDNMILNMLDKNLDLDNPLETSESKHSGKVQPRKQNVNINKPKLKVRLDSSNLSNSSNKEESSNANYFLCINRLRKEKMESELILTKHKIAIAEREKYKLDLELIKLEKELNIRKISSFTLPYYSAQESAVLPPENMGQHFLTGTAHHLRL